jgi:tetratricopeptide (TPR) repeat protein
MAYVLKQPECGFMQMAPPMIGEKGTNSSIKQAVMNLILKRSEKDFLLFYFAGHAIPINRDIYFVTYDFQEDTIEEMIEVDPDFYFSMRWLWKVLYQSSAAGRVLIILDCCFAGNMVEMKDDPLKIDFGKLLDELNTGSSNKDQMNRLRLMLTATGYNIQAQELDGHGLLTGLLLKALRGEIDDVLDKEGHVDIRVLHTYLQDHMPKQQRPDLAGKFGPYNCILASHSNRSERLRRQAFDNNMKIEVERGILSDLFRIHAETQHTQPFDHAICHGASLADLDEEKITEFLKRERTQQDEAFLPDSSAQAQLMHFGFLQNAFPTYGALLCFGQTPSKWIAGATTRCIDWGDDLSMDHIQDSREFKGSLLKQFELSLNFIKKRLRLSKVISHEGREEQWEIPIAVVEEALANALVHREYANRTDPVRVEVFNDRIEISSPGTLPSPMTEELLHLKHKSFPRNPQIAGIFYLYGYIEKLGKGIQRMQRFMKEENLEEPEFKLGEDKTFTVVLNRPKYFSLEASPSTTKQKNAFEVFISYSHQDQSLRNELDTHLANLKRQAIITSWYDGDIKPGEELQPQIIEHLNSAQIILLLISPDFLASDFCYSIEMKKAIAKHEANQARVIPIILRSTNCKGAPFEKIQALPMDGKPVTDWPNQDNAFLDIVRGIRKAIDDLVIKGVPTNQERLWNIPYERNLLFTGRENVLTRLNDALKASKTAALSGLGGIGKTQTTVEYAYRYRNDYDTILWVKAESLESINSDFVTIAHLLNLPEKQEQEQHRIIEAVKRWFKNHSGWLLILDNADDLEMVRAFLPTDGQGYILLTTRAQATRRIAQRIEIEEMDVDEGALFLLRRAAIIDSNTTLDAASIADQTTAREISQVMDGLPLALDQVGAYIEETQSSLSDYLHLFQTRKEELLQRRGKLTTDHPNSVATTWSLAFEKVQQANPAAADLLRLFSFLAPDVIQEEIITKGASELGSNLQPVAADPIKLNEAIGTLLTYSLVRRNPDHTLSIQRLVQVVLKQGMKKSVQRLWAERAIRAVNQAFPEVDYENWLRCQEYIPQVLICDALIEQWDMSILEAAQLLDDAGYYLYKSANYEEAEPLLQRALVIREHVLGSDHPDTALSLNNLALLYHNQGKYEQAEPLYQRALTIDEKAYGSDHSEVATDLNNLALLYASQGKYEEAEPLYQRSLAIYEHVLGPDHPDMAGSLNNLAGLYRYQRKYELAEPLMQRALAIRERVLGSDHPDTASSLNNLALLYDSQGKYEEAEPLYQRALAIYERMLGPDHPDTANSLNNLALLYDSQGKYELAEPLIQRALAIRERVLGPDHPDTANSLNNLALLYVSQSKYEEAEPLIQRALAIYEQVFGPDQPDTVEVRKNYSDLLRKMKG